MIYKDSVRPISERIEDLLSRMTLQEKVAQLTCSLIVGDVDTIQGNMQHGIGTLSYLNSSLSGDNGQDRKKLRSLQQYLIEETRLGIPALVHNEGIAGAQIPGATTFPQSMNVASTWDTELARKIGETVRKQLLAYGIRAVHSPLFDLARDPRWGRVGETYGEDPYLVAQMGVAYVKGIQGEQEIMATAKHFIGYGNAEGGRNGGEQQIDQRKLFDTYCFPFEAAIHEAGVTAVMNSYGILNEQAVSTSKWLLTDVLRGKLGFEGLVVADYGSISHAHARYRVAKNQQETAILALKAGMDVEQPSNSIYRTLVEAVELGEIEEAYIDRSVRRVLETKFRLGLFENPYEIGDFDEEIENPEYAKLSLEIAEKSIVMAKNEDQVLPLRKGLKIALVGPSADSKTNFFGGYSSVNTASTISSDFDRSEEDHFIKTAYAAMITEYKHVLAQDGIVFEEEPSAEQKELIIARLRSRKAGINKTYQTADEFVERFYPDCKSVREALVEKFGEDHILYAQGCDLRKPIAGGIEAAIQAAGQADIVIAILGGKESMTHPDATEGENKDNTNIGLEKTQLEMMEELFKLGKPVVTVIVSGRPLTTPLVSERSKAVLYAWLPAQQGAKAIANILAGACNPSGKLPVTILKDVSQIPMYHSRLPFFVEIEDWAEYVDSDMNKPLYPFGHGLSYTTFAYSDLKHDAYVHPDGVLTVSFKIRNTGQLRGDEVVQIYIRDRVSSIVRPVKQLVGFVRISLGAGETRDVTAEIDMKQLAFHDLSMNQVVEPGEMDLFIAASSQDIRLQGYFEIIGDKLKIERKVFASKIMVR
ncbi:glycoside hydrolase family 3 N-terminal domain-containing protein [Paenibacillus terreus]|uniref:Glycoside hydrolase family 3 N-terminal domain-containing protein n=2 Tax=Paenibacillus terreus TaxID=1387834 RepID=A0ABV5BEJ2_9BACL